MKRWMHRCILLLAVLLATTVFVPAYEIPEDFTGMDLEQVMADFMAANGLHEGNYSVSYYNTVTGESYAFNDETFMVAASTFKLPLNMYYYEMEQEGLIAPDAYISRVGAPLNEAHYQSLVWSNNEMSIGMLYNLGEFRDYKELMRKYFTMTDEEIDYSYYVDNYYCTRMMMDALAYLYEYRADFDEMIGYMKQAQPNEYFRAGVKDYEVAHKYGLFEKAVNDVGIIYTPQPFLLAVYTQELNAQVVADTAALLTAYTVWQLPVEPEKNESLELEVQLVPKEDPVEETPDAPVEPEPAAPVEPVQPEEPAEEKPAFAWWMVAVALGVFAIGGGGALLLLNPRKLQDKYEKKYEDRMSPK